MAKFMGTYEHTLDDKGRLILPAAFRPKLAQGAVTVPLDRCLAILPPDEFERMAAHLKKQVSEGRADMDHLRAFASLADEAVPDSQGRMRLAPHLRDSAGLGRNVVVAGVLERIEVWDPARWSSVFPSGAAKLVSSIVREYGLGPPDPESIT
ncbi:MAG: division/cell wall cluster transcriptional repressor MraZ [Acidimicrobiaceae bacterium]|nr:division/cell wall cluster transcriptional repressor MraZ [Acidimicrobiaceae bacterium]